MQLSPGHRIGPYQIVSVLGMGGMGEVYRARDTRLGRDIALKMVSPGLTPSPDLVGRFEQEARLAGSLNHPNLLAVYDVGEHEGVPYLITELLEGESLRRTGPGRDARRPQRRLQPWRGALRAGERRTCVRR